MVRRELLTAAVGAAVASCVSSVDRARDHVLRGFVVVDPGRQKAEVRDVYVVGGKVSLAVPTEGARLPIIEGRGRWLVPGLHDARIASWGNASPRHCTKLYQDMGVDTLLKAHLFAGVTQVVVGVGTGKHFHEGLRRVELMKIASAQVKWACRGLCAHADDPPGAVCVDSPREVAPALQAEIAEGGSYVQIHYSEMQRPVLPPVSKDVLREALAFAKSVGRASWVTVGTWAEVEDAVALGATLVQGLPAGEPPADLLAHMTEKDIFLAPTLGVLDMGDPLTQDPALDDPLTLPLVRQDVRQSYRDLSLYEGYAKTLFEMSGSMRALARQTLQRCDEANVKLVVATDSGWSPGAFQGVAVHRSLYWMGWAGLRAWSRILAATLWPARILGAEKPLEDGSAANFAVLTDDPLQQTYEHSSVEAVCLRGRWLDRDSLRPDLVRRPYYPR